MNSDFTILPFAHAKRWHVRLAPYVTLAMEVFVLDQHDPNKSKILFPCSLWKNTMQREADTQTKTLMENCRWAKNNLQGNLEGLQAAPVSKQVAAGRVCNCLDKIKTRRNATKQLTWVYLRLPIIHSCTSFWVKTLVNETNILQNRFGFDGSWASAQKSCKCGPYEIQIFTCFYLCVYFFSSKKNKGSRKLTVGGKWWWDTAQWEEEKTQREKTEPNDWQRFPLS